MVAEGDRLRDLQVREARHDRVGVRLGEVDQRAAQRGQSGDQRVDLAAQPQADVGGHLVVARAPGVQPLAGVADQRGEPLLDVEVDVLEVARPRELAALDLAADDCHAALDRREVRRVSTPAAASIRACASDPAMSAAARRRSKSTDAV